MIKQTFTHLILWSGLWLISIPVSAETSFYEDEPCGWHYYCDKDDSDETAFYPGSIPQAEDFLDEDIKKRLLKDEADIEDWKND